MSRLSAVLLSVLLPAAAFAGASSAPASSPASRPATRPGVHDAIRRGVEAHGGSASWRSLGTALFTLEMTRMDTTGVPLGPPTPFRIAFPTSGEADIEAQMQDGTLMRYVEGRVEVTDPDENPVESPAARGQARFMLPTFQYILSLPWKLEDPGVRTAPLPARTVNGRRLDGVRVTYDPGVGETPDDWYKFYFDAETGRLHDVLWIVTAPGHDNTIEWCRFEDLREIEGLLLPHRWVFVFASEDGTEIGPPMMEIRLTDVNFVADDLEDRPASRPAASNPSR